jgi:hypothetical protein
MLEKFSPMGKGGKYPEANFEIEGDGDGDFTIKHDLPMNRRDVDRPCGLQDHRGQCQKDPTPFRIAIDDFCGVGTVCRLTALGNSPPIVFFLIDWNQPKKYEKVKVVLEINGNGRLTVRHRTHFFASPT